MKNFKAKNQNLLCYVFYVFAIIVLFASVFFTSSFQNDSLCNYDFLNFILFGFVYCMLFAVSSIFNKSDFLFTKLDLFVLLFIVYILINFYFYENNYDIKLLGWVLLTMVYFCLRFTFTYECDIILSYFIILSAIFQCVVGILQLFDLCQSTHIYYKVTGTFNNPGPYAIYITTIMVLATEVFIEKINSIYLRLTAMLLILLGVFVIPLTESRTSLLSFIVGLTYILLSNKTYFLEKFLKQKKFIKYCLWVILLCIFLWLCFVKSASTFGRLLSYRLACNMVSEKVLYGHGFNSFRKYISDYQAKLFLKNNSALYIKYIDSLDYVFNDYLQLSVELGIIGLILFLIILYKYFAINFFIKLSSIETGFTGMMLTLLVAAFTSYPFEILPTLFLLFIILSIGTKNRKAIFDDILVNKRIKYAIFSIILLTSFYTSYSVFEKLQYYKESVIANRLLKIGKYSQAKNMYEDIFKHIDYDYKITALYGKSLERSGEYMKAIKVYKQGLNLVSDNYIYMSMGACYFSLKKYELAEEVFRFASAQRPDRMLPHFSLMRLYVAKNRRNDAQAEARIVIAMSKRFRTTASYEMRMEANSVLVN